MDEKGSFSILFAIMKSEFIHFMVINMPKIVDVICGCDVRAVGSNSGLCLRVNGPTRAAVAGVG